ncbi:MAG: epoxyqueuosine reductase [Clostridiales bacterium]|nr:epoxyqueuosine reductase [Clostridiales bacterium]
MNYSMELKDFLLHKGAAEVGFANLSGLVAGKITSGVSILLCLPKDVVKSISDGPNEAYYQQYLTLNDKLIKLAKLGADFIRAKGYEATAQIPTTIARLENYRTELPHKTVATRAGLGWIGKSALFVTKEYGSAIRLTSIVTDMKLDYGTPINKSICGSCNICVDACPGKALSGKLWDVETDRDELFDAIKCSTKAKQLTLERLGEEVTICGKCIEICPYTQKYIKDIAVE